jgi:hypothetical protein
MLAQHHSQMCALNFWDPFTSRLRFKNKWRVTSISMTVDPSLSGFMWIRWPWYGTYRYNYCCQRARSAEERHGAYDFGTLSGDFAPSPFPMADVGSDFRVEIDLSRGCSRVQDSIPVCWSSSFNGVVAIIGSLVSKAPAQIWTFPINRGNSECRPLLSQNLKWKLSTIMKYDSLIACTISNLNSRAASNVRVNLRFSIIPPFWLTVTWFSKII